MIEVAKEPEKGMRKAEVTCPGAPRNGQNNRASLNSCENSCEPANQGIAGDGG
jgi:hypothetical protein